MDAIELNRRFQIWDKDSGDEPSYWWPGFASHLVTWKELQARRRVVLLAEAGSGKTVELKHQAELLDGGGNFAFYATLQDVARDGLSQTLNLTRRARFEQWRSSQAPGRFFIDSIDEAKIEKIRLDNAFSRIAEGIVGHEDRAFIVLSGRHTEWEFERDLERLENVLPIPEPEAPPPPELGVLIRRIVNHEPRPAPPEREAPLVVLMAPLDDVQMHRYSEAQGVADADAFLLALRKANVLEIARRPLDLDWLVRYWRANAFIGGFAEMVRESLRERLKETSIDRSRFDPLSEEKAMLGLQRAAAALVFARKRTFAIPDSVAPASFAQEALDINAVLPDWVPVERVALLNRAVFDPAAYGRARLHNDNDGVVRSYLTAQWLRRLRATNLSARQLHALIFARNYGVDLIRPSMRETAAWLSIDDEGVAREVIRRQPVVLFDRGDPASLSPVARAEALEAVTARILDGEEMAVPNAGRLRRFAQPDVASTLRKLWDAHAGEVNVRVFLLKLIWFGGIRECADIAAQAAYDSFDDKRTQFLGGRALLAAGDPGDRQKYAARIRDRISTFPHDGLVAAIEELFPDFLTVDDLIAAFAAGRLHDYAGGTSLKWSRGDLMARLCNPEDLERLMVGLLDLDSVKASRDDGALPGESNDAPEFLLSAAADRLLEISKRDAAPTCAIDVVLFYGDRFSIPITGSNEKLRDAVRRLHESGARRRAAFWRAAEILAARSAAKGMALKSLHHMTLAGWTPGLQPEDLDWLLEDGPVRKAPGEQRLAANAAMILWDKQNRSPALLARVKEAAASSQEMAEEIETFLRPPASSPEYEESVRLRHEVTADFEKRREDDEKRWIDFVSGLRSDSDPLSKLLSPVPGAITPSLADLWVLLQGASRESARLGVPSTAPLAELVGQKAADAFVHAGARAWRERCPLLRSGLAPEKRNNIGRFDGLGITAITVEAAANPLWANGLNAAEAARAAEYATVEINAFPQWLESLAEAWPKAVEEVLMKEVQSEIDLVKEQHRPTLEHIAQSSLAVTRLMARPIWSWIESHTDIAAKPLGAMLSIVQNGMSTEMRPRAYELAIQRFSSPGKQDAPAARYLRLAAAIDPQGAVRELIAKLDKLDAAGKTALMQEVLPQLFGSRLLMKAGIDGIDVPTLQKLVAIAYRTVRETDDNDRTNGDAYYPEVRDNAQDAREIAFNILVQTPGQATFDALHELKAMPEFSEAHLEMLARDRAAQDSELRPWTGDAALQYERRWEKEPSTGRELQMLAMQRIEDIQHDLLHSDFAQGPTLSALPDEAAVQSWLADRMRLTQGWSYSVEREPETVAAKKPDIVLTARAANAKVPTEIKVAESWTLGDLEVALSKQLCGQYLRARDCREGLLVIVHQKPRPVGWEAPDGSYLSFAQLVERLKEQAQRIRQSSPFEPQPEIAVVDVSTCVRVKSEKSTLRRRARGKPATTKATDGAKPKRGGKDSSAQRAPAAVAGSRVRRRPNNNDDNPPE